MMSEDIECSKLCLPAASLTDGESLLHLLKLVCQDPECGGLNCNHGCYKEVNKDCHKILDESDMFMLHIEFSTPLNFVCEKCIGKVKFLRKYSLGSHQQNNSVRSACARCNGMRRIFPGGFWGNSRNTKRYRCINSHDAQKVRTDFLFESFTV